jgi:hypothetical protein
MAVASTQPKPRLVTRVGSALRQTGFVVSGGIDLGPPTVSAMPRIGILRTAEDADHRRRHVFFASAGGHVCGFGKTPTWSPTRGFSGVETNLLLVGRHSPIYGDRVEVPIIPGVLWIGAGRKGGLGFSASLFPVPFLSPWAMALARLNLTVYASHPALARVANPFLDTADRVFAKGRSLRERLLGRRARVSRAPASRLGE